MLPIFMRQTQHSGGGLIFFQDCQIESAGGEFQLAVLGGDGFPGLHFRETAGEIRISELYPAKIGGIRKEGKKKFFAVGCSGFYIDEFFIFPLFGQNPEGNLNSGSGCEIRQQAFKIRRGILEIAVAEIAAHVNDLAFAADKFCCQRRTFVFRQYTAGGCAGIPQRREPLFTLQGIDIISGLEL